MSYDVKPGCDMDPRDAKPVPCPTCGRCPTCGSEPHPRTWPHATWPWVTPHSSCVTSTTTTTNPSGWMNITV